MKLIDKIAIQVKQEFVFAFRKCLKNSRVSEKHNHKRFITTKNALQIIYAEPKYDNRNR